MAWKFSRPTTWKLLERCQENLKDHLFIYAIFLLVGLLMVIVPLFRGDEGRKMTKEEVWEEEYEHYLHGDGPDIYAP